MSRTDHLFDIIRDEIDARPTMPTLIMGDYNATARNIPSVRHMLDELAWTDLGTVAHRWGGKMTNARAKHTVMPIAA